MSDFKLHHGKMEEELKKYPDNFFSACVVDPPYGLGKEQPLEEVMLSWLTRGYHEISETGGFMGRKWDTFVPQPIQWKEAYRVMKPGAHLVAFFGCRTYDLGVIALRLAGFEVREQMGWMFAQGFPKSKNDGGLGSALKPAHEPIVLCRKPLDGTFEQNFAKWGTGYLNIDACRIPLNGGYKSKPNGRPSLTGLGDNYVAENANQSDDKGRWPANILTDGSDEVLSVFPESDGQNGYVGPENGERPSINTYGDWGPRPAAQPRGDTGSAARFFYCAKTSREDRNEGCDHLKSKPLLWSSGTENPGSFQSPGTEKASPNNWPTVKPTNLMRYLIRLVTPKVDGAIVLDPMMGSGSTGKAAMYEFVNFVGIDQEADAMPIAEARLRHALRNRGTMNIF